MGLLRAPDLYTVGVATAGGYGMANWHSYWSDYFQGLMPGDSAGISRFASQSLSNYADSLRGHLLLMQGDLDTAVPQANTLRLVAALIAADKRFDLMILPDRGHEAATSAYALRLCWDYFVRHLLGVTPPDPSMR